VRDLVLIVAPDPFTRRLLRRALAWAEYDCLAAVTGPEGLALARARRPAVILLDAMLPDGDGIAVCQRLRRVTNGVIIALLDARSDLRTRVESLDLGADDYVTKPVEVAELLARIRAQLRRFRADGARRLRFADLEVDPLERTARRGPRRLSLTSKEFEILLTFMRNPRRVLDRPTIFNEVWPECAEEQSNSLEVHLHNLRTKLHRPGEPVLLHTIRGAGYVLREPDGGQ
jgi:two-component system response regulator MprA